MKTPARKILSALLALFIILLLVGVIGPEKFRENVSRMNPLWLIPLYAVFTLIWLLKGLRWKLMLRQNGHEIPVLSAASLSLLGNFSNLLVPAKLGDMVWIYGAKKKHGIGLSVAFATVMLDRFYDFIAVITLALVSMLLLLGTELPPWLYYVMCLGIMAVLSFITLVLLIVKYRKHLKRIKIEKLEKAVNNVVGVLSQAAKNKRMSAFFMLLGFTVWLLQAIMCYLIAHALGVEAGFLIVLFAILVTNITQAFPVTPGNMGVYEAALAGILLLQGIGIDTGLTIAMIDHLVKIMYVVIAGGIISASHLFKGFRR